MALIAAFANADSEEVFVDIDTKLMWQDNENTISMRKKWDEAKDYCKNSSLSGYRDWRLPDKDMLKTLYLKKESLKYMQSAPYLSSSSYMDNGTDPLSVIFMTEKDIRGNKANEAYAGTVARISGSSGHVRCVRDADVQWRGIWTLFELM